MAKYSFPPFVHACFILASTIISVCNAIDEDRRVHIVYMGSLPAGSYSPTTHHLRMLQQVTGDNNASKHLIRSYGRSFNGFSAMLTDQEREKFTNMKGVVYVFPSIRLQLQTTRSWDFIGLQESAQRNQTAESNVIIGVLDTGIWPESDSFQDEGFGPIPKKWKGTCAGGNNFTCNNKVIGARYYRSKSGDYDITSARDTNGHGSHTASIAAGNKVTSVSFYGIAKGIARGGVPSARIAVYSVCSDACESEAVLAGFDDAIADGVDFITASLGPVFRTPLENDTIAIGSFHAMVKGILTINSAGNFGPDKASTASLAPWLFSVAASTMDRRIIDKVSLGNGLTLEGRSVNAFISNGTMIPLVHGRTASYPNCSDNLCYLTCLDPKLVKGKILLCENDDSYPSTYNFGIFGSVFRSDQFEAEVVGYPMLRIDSKAYDIALSYANSATRPQAKILGSETITNTNAPKIADFSSRGPNLFFLEIMKPGISAPGIEILAAYSPVAFPSAVYLDRRSVKYNILSGTSMSCPHVTGIAAYVKSFHSDWSPAAIKSSIMTTAMSMKGSDDLNEFAYGSGHVDPVQAINPGLVFDLYKSDYLNLLCNSGYNTSTVRKISGDNTTCPSSSSQRSMVRDINYPSLATSVAPMQPFLVNFTRIVLNVGFANSTYKASVQQHPSVNITIIPQVLSFKSLNEKQVFTVNVMGGNFSNDTILSSSLLWEDGTHRVRCPIIVYVYQKA